MSTVQPQHPVVAEPAAGPSPVGVASPAGVPVGAPQLFRGRTLEALLPQIRAALGPDAIVLRRREGLSGGVGGFFQQRFVEVEAVAGQPGGFDAYDDAPAWPEDVSPDGVQWLEDEAGPAALPAAAPPAAALPAAAPPAAAPPAAAPPAVAVPSVGAPAAGALPAAAPSGAAPFLAAAAAGTPIDGAAFLRHLDEAVERRNALAPGATHEAFESAPPARGFLAREDVAPRPVVADLPATSSGRGTVSAYTRAGVVPSPATPVVARFPRIASSTAPVAASAPVAVPEAPAEPVLAAVPAPLQVLAPVQAPTAPTAAEPGRPARALGRRTAVPAPPARDGSPTEAWPQAPSIGLAGPPEFAPAATRPVDRRPDVEVAVPERSSVDADVAEYGLIARGLSPAVARSVVLEAAAHGQPLDAGHRIDRATRAALARRIPQTAPRGGVRTMVIVGAPGAGRTSAVGALAAAHARAGRRVLAVAMDAADGGAALATTLVGTDAELLVATGGATAAAAIRAARPDVCVVDTPAVHPSDDAAVQALAAELRALGADEVHLAVPGTDQSAAALGALDGLEPLRPDALLMTHRDRADRPGGVVGASIVRGLPIAYVTDGRAVALAEPARLARMVQP